MQITIAITPGNPKTPDVLKVNGVISAEKPVNPEVKCNISRVEIPIKAEKIKVLKNVFVLIAKNNTIKTDIIPKAITM